MSSSTISFQLPSSLDDKSLPFSSTNISPLPSELDCRSPAESLSTRGGHELQVWQLPSCHTTRSGDQSCCSCRIAVLVGGMSRYIVPLLFSVLALWQLLEDTPRIICHCIQAKFSDTALFCQPKSIFSIHHTLPKRSCVAYIG